MNECYMKHNKKCKRKTIKRLEMSGTNPGRHCTWSFVWVLLLGWIGAWNELGWSFEMMEEVWKKKGSRLNKWKKRKFQVVFEGKHRSSCGVAGNAGCTALNDQFPPLKHCIHLSSGGFVPLERCVYFITTIYLFFTTPTRAVASVNLPLNWDFLICFGFPSHSEEENPRREFSLLSKSNSSGYCLIS